MIEMISVIITIYNAEKYVRQCIESVQHQTYHNLEIILVDDGSTDASGQIIAEMAERDRRIKVFTKENGGVSSARNKGIDLASADIIMFVDSDDYLAERTVEVLYESYMREPQKIPQCNFIELYGCREVKGDRFDGSKIGKVDTLGAVITGNTQQATLGIMVRAVCGKLFCRNIITENNIRFHDNFYYGEDAVFMLEYLQYADYICPVNYYGYYYRKLQGSACRRMKPDLYCQVREELYSTQKIMQQMGLANDPVIEISMTIRSWIHYRQLIHNERQITAKHTRDSDKWYINAQEYLNNSRPMPTTSKSIKLLWKINRMCKNRKVVHFVSVLCDEYDNRKRAIRRILRRE